MEQYDYRENIKSDIRDYIQEEGYKAAEWDREELYEELYEALWADDGVTGNGSGSYTFNAWVAEENLCHNMDLLAEAFKEFGEDGVDILKKGAEACDVTIRCYLLGECLSKVLDDLYDGIEDSND